MTKFRPIPKWKSITGIASSGVIAMCGLGFCLGANYVENKDVQAALLLIGIVLIAVGLFFLFINLYLFKLSNIERNKLAAKKENNNQNEKMETLHKLLAEGKISIEEYDKLSK